MIQIALKRYVRLRSSFMGLNKHIGVRIFVLMKRSKSFILSDAKKIIVCTRILVGAR